ncbi:traB domain-containing protein isoform X1 [Octopus bimaculoides]|uniref:TraB domain-containing protein n=2 Tax=Octopus bimaculoides TaxID=37653 RepID=A0A0L8FYX9_OCTBM|nr:traB domain-containing protein isoform X1 [Octopus bimaculoides]|eukprot:XP_014785665.1 PREDICTED: traB domain-containing protein-like isoform X1 [Octopus bimaculoides]
MAEHQVDTTSLPDAAKKPDKISDFSNDLNTNLSLLTSLEQESDRIAFLDDSGPEKLENMSDSTIPKLSAVDSLEVFSDPDSDLVTYSGDESEIDDDDDDDDDNDQNSLHSVRHITKIELPSTVTVLLTEHGSKVYIVGTAHFSLESQEDVAKTIQCVKPDIVMVELCSSRVNILQLDEETLLEEAKNINLEKIKLSIKQSGVVQGCLHLLLLSLSAHLTKELGMAPGGEFRRAFKEALNIPGCDFHLGDRPIQVTLRRALQSLSWWQKLRLTWFLLTTKEPITKEDVEMCKQKDLLEQMLKEMTGEFPALSRVFVEERDIFLAYSLKKLSKPDPESKTNPIVVGVVGLGHIPGIVQNWDKDCDIKEIMKCPPPSIAGRLFRWTFRASLVGIFSWGCYRFYKWTVANVS